MFEVGQALLEFCTLVARSEHCLLHGSGLRVQELLCGVPRSGVVRSSCFDQLLLLSLFGVCQRLAEVVLSLPQLLLSVVCLASGSLKFRLGVFDLSVLN